MAAPAPTPTEVSEDSRYRARPEATLGTDVRCTTRQAVACFGSRARGDYSPDSDIDVAVVIRGLDRARKMAFEHATAVSALVLSEAEFDALLTRERRIALDIERSGVGV